MKSIEIGTDNWPSPAPVVRPYTEQEYKIINEDYPTGSWQRLVQLIYKNQIDSDRYEQAKIDHPEMSAHFERLQTAGQLAITGWQQYYADNYGVVLPYVVPYDGTESWLPPFERPPVNQFIADLPA